MRYTVKGNFNWIDLGTGSGRARKIGWAYPNPKPGCAFYNRETSETLVVIAS